MPDKQTEKELPYAQANPVLLGRREVAGHGFLQVIAWFCRQRAESDRELAEIMERQTSSLTQGGTGLLLLSLSQELESRAFSQQ
jgi:hypothetical protein